MSSVVRVVVVHIGSELSDDLESGLVALQAQVSDDLVRAMGAGAERFRLDWIESRASLRAWRHVSRSRAPRTRVRQRQSDGGYPGGP